MISCLGYFFGLATNSQGRLGELSSGYLGLLTTFHHSRRDKRFCCNFRCISDHGREARFPFLDEDVVSFLNSLPVWVKVYCPHACTTANVVVELYY